MNSFRSLSILLPCHSLEDFPVHHIGKEASSLLECWVALWHPDLIANCNSKPQWQQADSLADELDHSLILVPLISQSIVPDTLAQSCQESNSLLLTDCHNRQSIVSAAFAHLDYAAPSDQEQVGDFFALGYAYLQVQLMTRQLRYSSNLDEERFEELVILAAKASNSSCDSFQEKIQACFDMLLEEKSRYYPVEANLIDLTLIAETTLGNSLKNQLARNFKQNLLLTGHHCELMAKQHADSFHQLKERVAEESVEVVGGNQTELPDPLLCINSVIRNLEGANRTFQEQLNVRPTVYARRKSGLFPALPELLEKFAFRGALHANFDEGQIPTGLAANVRWEAPSGDSVFALAQSPVDANVAETFVNLGIRVGESIDSEHQATVVFAHWPNKFDPAFEDLLRVHRYGPLLGNFSTLSEHFDTVYDPGYGECHLAPEYRNAYLKQAIVAKQTDPISRYVRYWKRIWKIRNLQSLVLIAGIHKRLSAHQYPQTLEKLELRIDNDVVSNHDENLDRDLDELQVELCGRLSGKGENTTAINTLNFPRLSFVPTSSRTRPSTAVDDVFLRDCQGDRSAWVIQCPPYGHCELDPTQQSKKARLGPSVVEDGKLQNEFFRLSIDEQTGGIRSLNLYNRRVNLLSQHLAMREFSGHPNLDRPQYTSAVAEKISYSSETPLQGQAISQGKIMQGDQVLSKFQQTTTVKRGSRLIEFEIEFDSLSTMASGSGWDNYLCSRIAWLEETAKIRRELHSTKYQSTEKRICAPNYLEIDDLETRLTLITGGLPFHQRSGKRQLDSLLVCPGETQRKFKFAVAVNPKYSSQSTADWNTPPTVLQQTKLSGNSCNWLFHFNSKNIIVVCTKTLIDDNQRLCGVRFRLQETEGRRGDIRIRCPFPVKQAQLFNLFGVPMESLNFKENQVTADFLGSQLLDLQIHW